LLRNYIAAAFGAFSRSWLHTGIAVLGLAAGFAAAMLVGLYVRDEYSFERFITGYRDVYRLEMDLVGPDRKPVHNDNSTANAAANLALDFPDVQAVARLHRSSQWVGRGEAKTRERVAWADPDFFKVLPYPVLAGDPVAALHDPDGVVITRSTARRYFGVDKPIGRTLLLQAVAGDSALMTTVHPMRVEAVLKDVPSGTHLEQFKIFAAGKAAWSYLTLDDQGPPSGLSVWTYARLNPGASPDRIRAGLNAFAVRHHYGGGKFGYALRLAPLKDLHFTDNARVIDAGIAAAGGLIVLVATINFVTLMTARATRRAVEVGVRKVVGARRRDLILQFLGESLVYVLVAMLIGVAIVEVSLPSLNAFLERTIAFDYLDDPLLAEAILGSALATGLIAGLYPAMVLSSFRPASALKGGGGQPTGSAEVRQGLVVIQFAILTGLIIVTATVYRQMTFAMDNALRLNEDQVLYIVAPCDAAFKQELAGIGGVNSVACVSGNAVEPFSFATFVKDPKRGMIGIDPAPVDPGFFGMHGLKPLAGRFFSPDRGEDVVLDRPDPDPQSQPSVVLNETGVRRLGFKTPQDAVGRTISWARPSAAPPNGALPAFHNSRIVGVVRDFTLSTLRTPIDATMYFVDPRGADMMFARLDGRRIPETLRAIDQLWRRTGHVRPIYREFLGQTMRDAYHDVIVQGVLISMCTGLAILIAYLGLFALAAFTTERRTKEIGVRKAMGASSFAVARLLLWQFTKPVLWGALIAWPLAFWVADHWLHGFAYRVSLPPWLFLSASAAALLIAWATVGVHAWLVARTRPATALRYE
jgi:putative ABC transport system permease protein